MIFKITYFHCDITRSTSKISVNLPLLVHNLNEVGRLLVALLYGYRTCERIYPAYAYVTLV